MSATRSTRPSIEMMDDVDTIVDRYEGWCDDGGQIDEDHVPFSDMFRGAEDSGRPVARSSKANRREVMSERDRNGGATG